MYNRYQGNSGKVVRVKEQRQQSKPEMQQPKPKAPPLKQLGNPLKGILPNGIPELETEDLILLLMLYLMYRKSGDTDVLIIMGAMFLL